MREACQRNIVEIRRNLCEKSQVTSISTEDSYPTLYQIDLIALICFLHLRRSPTRPLVSLSSFHHRKVYQDLHPLRNPLPFQTNLSFSLQDKSSALREAKGDDS